MTKKQSKFLAFLLRHGADEFNLRLDNHGWAQVHDVVGIMQRKNPGLTVDDLKYIVETDSKERYQIENDRIRARYGHSIKVESREIPSKPPEVLYHGTARRNLGLIFSKGLRPMRRQYVHLSTNIEDARNVGRRHSQNVAVLKIRAEDAHKSGITFFRESNTYLTKEIPVEFIEMME
ncbi:MAG TPA: RNA 2'-phosphotransferase [candidate division Zixibacteria bacterium]|mgnify:CR=1 FL=1|nr:RNA 2'-phosphotransferase [candidate division Zixibacteria bacterium]HEQ97778.1 RNA 2'-phosphotransferase [candidate division Zixibacteria bacterium]